MSQELLKEFIESIIRETREEDIANLRKANNSYIAVFKFLSDLGKNLKRFEAVFLKNNGWMETLNISTTLSRNEHQDVEVSFRDRGFHSVSSKVNARAIRIKDQPDNPLDFKLKKFSIEIYFDAPPEAKKHPRTYNAWFAKNIEEIFSKPQVRSSYIHEFTHVMDFKRMSPAYLQQRTNKKTKDLEKNLGKQRNFKAYANDPVELNAYFMQALFAAKANLKKAKTEEQKQDAIGKTPNEFAEKFIAVYLRPQIKKNLSPENIQRLMKRAATAWEHLK